MVPLRTEHVAWGTAENVPWGSDAYLGRLNQKEPLLVQRVHAATRSLTTRQPQNEQQKISSFLSTAEPAKNDFDLCRAYRAQYQGADGVRELHL